jgi:Pentapeptide repeats (8 copies)
MVVLRTSPRASSTDFRPLNASKLTLAGPACNAEDPNRTMPRELNRKRADHSWTAPAALGVTVVLLLLGCIFVFPSFLVDHDLGSTPSSRLKPEAKLKATNDVRTTLLQGLAGAFFLATAYFTWRQLRVSQGQLQVSEDQQIAERFTRAIDQLGKNDSIDVRLGGVFALEHIAHASPAYGEAIGEVLAAYVREHSPWPRPPEATVTKVEPDVQAALTVLGRTAETRSEERPINLCSVDLREANLRDAMLRGVLLNDSNLAKAHLEGADLVGAKLVNANLRGACLEDTDLQRAKLIDAELQGAKLVSTDLGGANLTGAFVDKGSRLIKTKLEGAILRNVALEKAPHGDLSYDDKTEWPAGFKLRDQTVTAASSPPQ